MKVLNSMQVSFKQLIKVCLYQITTLFSRFYVFRFNTFLICRDTNYIMSGQSCVVGDATLSESHDEMKYSLFTSVSTEKDQLHDQHQLVLYIFDRDNETAAKASS